MIYHIGTNSNPTTSKNSPLVFGYRSKDTRWTMCGIEIKKLNVMCEWFYQIEHFMAFKQTPEDVCPSCNLKILGGIDL